MASYGQWAASSIKNGPSRLTWVCGESRVLVNEVIGATANAIGADDAEQWRAGKDREQDIWSAVLAIPARGYKRLTVIRDAGKLKDWQQLRYWMDSRALMQGSYVLFEAEETDFPKDDDGKLAPPADMLRDSAIGQIVRCSPLSPDDAVAWLIRQLPAVSEGQARHLLLRTSGDLGEVKAVLAKAGLFGGRITDEALDLLCAELPGDFADRLIVRDLPGAMLAADTMDEAVLSYSLGYLTSRLPLLSVLHRAELEHVSRRDVIAKLGVSAFLAQKYTRIAVAEYGESRVRRAWLALSAAEDAHRGGVSAGVAEVLVTSWWG
jgi:hypothetical protein